MSTMTISQAAAKLNVTTVRVHGLIKDGKLVVSEQPINQGGKFVKGLTVESVEKYLANRKAQAGSNGTRQYILSLSAEQVAELQAAGYELKARFESKKQ